MKEKIFFFILVYFSFSFGFTHAQNIEEYEIKPNESYTHDFPRDKVVEIAFVVTNKSVANIANFAVLGAPDDAKASLNGKELDSLNGYFSILPNSPCIKLIGYGKFKGTRLIISNLSNLKHPAVVLLKVVILDIKRKH